ncbi:MAG: hypothetical protein ACPGQS_07385, partial [Bradymonadia bacterium]
MRRCTYLLFFIWLQGGYAYAGPAEELRDAENSYLYGDYARVLRKIIPVIEPDLLLSDENKIARAYELAGLASFFLEDKESARRQFEKLIRLRPNFRLDPVKVPPPAISFFDQLRDQLKEDIARIRAALQKHAEEEERKKRLANLVKVRRDVKINSRTVALLPFGIGQFQNDDHTLGQFFLASQALSAAASIGFFLGVESMRTSSGRFRTSDVTRARQFRTAQMTTGVTALALALIGIAEAQWSFKQQTTLQEETITGAGPGEPK